MLIKSKKTLRRITTAIFFIAMWGVASNSFASIWQPYLGVGYRLWDINWGFVGSQDVSMALEDQLHGIQLTAGTKISEYFGMEIEYAKSASGEKTNALGSGLTTKVRMEHFGFNFLGYFPINQNKTVKLLALLGFNYINPSFNNTTSVIGFTPSEEDRLKIGLGAEWFFTNNLSARFLAIFSDPHFGGFARHMSTFNFGIMYYPWQ